MYLKRRKTKKIKKVKTEGKRKKTQIDFIKVKGRTKPPRIDGQVDFFFSK